MSFRQFKADLERLEIQYPFRQIIPPENDPIEHTAVVASRWEGETVTMVTGRFFNRFVVTNKVVLTAEEAASRALDELLSVPRIVSVQEESPSRVERVLLPYGGAQDEAGEDEAGDTVAALRHAYRMPIQGTFFIQGPIIEIEQFEPIDAISPEILGFWYLWLDAETGEILQLEPLVADAVQARGRTWRRAPDRLPTTDLLSFQVNNAVSAQYTLQLDEAAPLNIFQRVDRLGDGDFNDGEVSISDSTNGSSSTFANFDQATNGINDANAFCNNDPMGDPVGADETFQQVDLFATLFRQRSMAVNAGLFTPFPTSTMSLGVEGDFCNAFGSPTSLSFGSCSGFG